MNRFKICHVEMSKDNTGFEFEYSYPNKMHLRNTHKKSEINGQLKVFELKYELSTCKWFLWKV